MLPTNSARFLGNVNLIANILGIKNCRTNAVYFMITKYNPLF